MKRLHPRRLVGDAFARGRAQASVPGVDIEGTRITLEERFKSALPILSSNAAQLYLDRQMAFSEEHCGNELEELRGVCEGFRIPERTLFSLMHLPILSGRYEIDGCSAWARPLPNGGAVLAKNRDLSGLHRHGQDVFLHVDGRIQGGALLCVGTLGIPGAYSSGMNAAGLALADTAISAPRYGIGWSRYFLMTRLLSGCRSVDEACDYVARVRHAGGGSLILADSTGAVATIELFADAVHVDRAGSAFRTNHFRHESAAKIATRISPAALSSTLGRSATLEAMIGAGLGLHGIEAVMAAMADHGDAGRAGLCCHGSGDGSHTVSTAIYDTRSLTMTFARGAPCTAGWETESLGELMKAKTD
jgi:predicted choloylglycine hydrolase